MHEQRISSVSRGNTFPPPGKRAFPLVEKIPAARATRYDDIPFCMGKQSKTCEIFELDELLTHGNFQIVP